MTSKHLSTKVFFIFSCIPLLIIPFIFPSFHLTFFAPFLIIAYYRLSFTGAILIAMICGSIIDFLSDYQHLGIHALNYTLTSYFLYDKKHLFFADKLSTLPIMTYFFSALSTFIQIILLSIFENPIPFSLTFFIKEIIIMPFFDSFYALLYFAIPISILQKRRKFI